MKVTVSKSVANGSVTAPPSKSMAHRLLICAALSNGKSTVNNVNFSQDIIATINCLECLGAKFECNNSTVTVTGVDFNTVKNVNLNCNESGSTLRFLIPVCLLFNKQITLNGTERLLSRSLEIYEEIFKKQQISFFKTKTSITLNGNLLGGEYNLLGNVSSQFISGLMFALPNLKVNSTIKILDEKESAPYIDLTVDALNTFGVKIKKVSETEYFVLGNQKFVNNTVTVEGDYSNAAFLDAFNCFGGSVKVNGLNNNSLQGDKVYLNHFKTLCKGYQKIDLSNCPDLSMIFMAVAAANKGAEFTGTKRLAIKESNRGVAFAEELAKFGIKTDVYENKIVVNSGTLCKPNLILNSHNDHRIVMALTVLCSLTGGEIENAEAVNKSYPDFFEKVKQLGIKVKTNVT